MVTIEEGKIQLQEQLKQAGYEMIRDENDLQKKRIAGTLLKRQGDVLEILDCVESEIKPEYFVKRGRKGKGRLVRILLHPAVSIILSLAALVFMVLSIQSQEWYVTAVILALLTVQSICRLIKDSKANDLVPEPEAQTVIDMERAELVLERISGKCGIDCETICNMFASQNLDQMNAFENEVVKIYSSLYEAKLDNPEVHDFSYAVTLTELLLEKLGLKTIGYSRENESMFTIERADYHDEMRCPAIVRVKNGELVRKGEFIKNKKS